MTTLVNSHLHIDHVGGNQLFAGHERPEPDPRAGARAGARTTSPFEFFGYSDKSWDYDGANIETFSGDVELTTGVSG